MKNKKIVLIPVETIKRELDSKICLAHEIANEDVVCIVAQHNYLNKIIKQFKGGVFLGKNIFPDLFPTTSKYYKELKKHGFSLLYYHEEGGLYAGDENEWKLYLKRQIDESLLEEDDAILCWGPYQANYYNENSPKFTAHNVGVGRLELRERDILRKMIQEFSPVKMKDFILINTNFAIVNHQIGYLETLKWDQLKNMETRLWYADTFQIMGSFLKLIIKLLHNNPTEQFVLRPHPSESLDVYKEYFKNYDNLTISKEFTAPDWINKCKVVIQNNCTTALEAFFLNKPIINYATFESTHSVNILQDFGVSARNFQEVQGLIEDIEKCVEQQKDPKQSKVCTLIDNFNHVESPVQKIKEIVHNSLQTKETNTLDLKKLNTVYLKANLRNTLVKFPRYLFPNKLAAYKMYISYFNGFSREYVESRVRYLNENKQRNTAVNYLNEELFILGG